MRCLVAGAGGFIGGYLVKRLLDQGHQVLSVDIKPKTDWWQFYSKANNTKANSWAHCDLRLRQEAFDACKGVDRVFNLAADMGGIGFIESNKADCMQSVLINTHLLQGTKEEATSNARYFYASSACVYHANRQISHQQKETNGFIVSWRQDVALKESDAYYNGGAMPEDGYGWEKLFSERMCRHFHEDYGVNTRVARFHNIYGPHGSWTGGREKAPAAICRKIAEAKRDDTGIIDVWGNGTITRSFCWINDCIDGLMYLMESDHREPINIGSSESVTVNQLIDCIEVAADYKVIRKYNTTKPQGVNGRNSDNAICKQVLGWEPATSLLDGISKTYPWIEEQVNAHS